MASKKKLLTSVVALGTAAALTLGGTFAWQSISQGAVNEASDVVNPGGRLHNDQHWVSDLENDTNIYVENFTEAGKGEDIYARVRLSEYMEVVMNYGTKAEVVDVVAGSKTLKDGVTDEGLTNDSATQQNKFDYEYDIHYFGEENKTDDFFTWTEGEADIDLPWFIPTFNKNKDSVAADLNGEYADTLGGISNRGESQYDYEEITEDTEDVTASAIYDTDSDKDDELKTLSYSDLKMLCETGGKMQNTTVQAALDNKDIQLVEETHAATQVGETKGLIPLSAWLEEAETEGYKDENGSLTEDGKEALYGYWVYDDSDDGNGWVYWSAPIAAGETTGLLLDGFNLNGVMDDTWYYAIDVEAQFVTADDVGSVEDNDGFYHLEGIDTAAIDLDDEDGETETTTPKAVSADAEELLKLIGVEIGDTTTGDDSGNSDDSDDDSDDDTDDDYTGEIHELTMTAGTSGTVVAITDTSSNKIKLRTYSGELLSGDIELCDATGDTEFAEKTDYTYNKSTGILTILLEDGDERLNETGTRLIVMCPTDRIGGDIVWGDDGELTLTTDRVDGTVASINTGVEIYDEEGEPVTSLKSVAWMQDVSSPLVDGTDYTLEDNTVTILNEEYAGRPIVIVGEGEEDEEPTAILYVAPAAKEDEDKDEDEDEEPAMQMLQLSSDSVNVVAVASQESFTVTGTDGETLSTDHLTVTAVQNGESKTLALDTDYTYSNGTLTITNSDLSNAYVCVSDNAGNKGYVHAAKGEDAYFLLHTGSDHYYEAACAPVNTAVRVETQSYGTPVETEEKKFEVKTADGLGEVTLTSGTDYRYNSENKTTLTITNDQYANRVLLVTFDGQSGYIFVTAAE